MPSEKDLNKAKKSRRRPTRAETQAELDDAFEAEADAETKDAAADAQAAFGFAENEAAEDRDADSTAEESEGSSSSSKSESKSQADDKVRIEFPYSELVRAKAPKVFDVAESVATEWKKDGNFENVPVGHPVAQMTVAAGLRKAKEVEKKLEEKGVFMMAKMGLEFAKSKLKR